MLIQFNTKANADKYNDEMRTTIVPSNMVTIGLMAVGRMFSNSAGITGVVSKHLCSHDNPESEWYDCKNDVQAQYTEVLK